MHHLQMSARDYTDDYERAGLLTPKTMLGHCILLQAREIQAIAKARAAVAHCPTSNLYLGSSLMKLDRIRAAGIAVGPELNMWQVMRAAVEVQRLRTFYEPEVPPLRVADAFHLATAGGARALGKSATIGTLEVGKEADLLVIDLGALHPYGKDRQRMNELIKDDVVALCVYRGGPAATRETYVRGRCVYRAAAVLPNE
ncbi:MAG: amidohydrolase family protein [Verrucomicrobiota bacterium]|nr:amidohydrolase family protein [Verrucomicrobiota bacterium]